VQLYGMAQWGDLFTARQKVALLSHISICQAAVGDDKAPYARGVLIAISATISKMADTNSVIFTWQIDPPRLRATFSRQALPITWDFAETCPLSDTAGNHLLAVGSILEVLENSSHGLGGNVEQADAVESPLPDQATSVWFTDPPYYDAVPYADLADFFLVWMRRTLLDDKVFHNRLETEGSLSLKDREIVQDDSTSRRGAPKDQMF